MNKGEMTFYDVSSGIETTADSDVTVTASDGCITVSDNPARVEVMTVNGTVISRNSTHINVTPGLYIVRTGNKTTKIAVK